MMKNILETAVFGGGCFWCTEAVFQRLRGVSKVISGYTGGKTENPTYNDLHYRNTGHVEAVEASYDPSQISYETLLDVFFGSHDPTSVNQQGNDIGPEYRSVIFYQNDIQKNMAEKKIIELTNEQVFSEPIVTTVEPRTKFYPAEAEHQNFYENNQKIPYCQVIISPKIAKLRQKYAHLLKGDA
jgi:peptide-methionine (S)-S-oxide reductase